MLAKQGVYMSEENTNSVNGQRYLEFNIGKEKYGVELLTVIEVISVPETTPLPNSPKYIEGIMNLRGQIITVVDLRTKLSIPQLEDQSEKATIIVKVNNIQVGVIVDSINKVINVHEKDLSEIVNTNKNKNAKFINSIYKSPEDYLVFLLSFERLLDLEEVAQVA